MVQQQLSLRIALELLSSIIKMTIDEDVNRLEKLFTVRFSARAAHGLYDVTFSEADPNSYEVSLPEGMHPNVSDRSDRVAKLRRVNEAIVHSMSNFFSDTMEYSIKQRVRQGKNQGARDFYLATISLDDETFPILGISFSDTEAVVKSAQELSDFLHKNTNGVLLNVARNFATQYLHELSLEPAIIRQASAEHMLFGVESPETIFNPKGNIYSSLAEYVAKTGGKIWVGDVIIGVEMTARVKHEGYGAFTVGNIPIRVPGSTPNDIYDVRITEQINAKLHRAEVVSS